MGTGRAGQGGGVFFFFFFFILILKLLIGYTLFPLLFSGIGWDIQKGSDQPDKGEEMGRAKGKQ